MPANRVPNIEVPLQEKDGRTNIVWWKYLKSLAAQFAGKDAPLMPVDVPGVLSVANAQARPRPLTEAAVIEAAQRIIAGLPRGAGRDGETADLARAAFQRRPQPNREAGALDLAAIANARVAPRQPAQAPQIIICTQATFPVLAGTPATFIYVSDFAHWIYWDGTTATFADGGSDYYTVAATAPSSIGWHAVDGSNVSFLNADGTLTAKLLKNVAATPGYLKVGAGADTLVAPVAPTFAGTPATPAGTVAAPVFTGTPQTFTTAAATATGAVNAFTAPNPYTPAGANSAPAFTGTPATPAGTISTTGEPENFYSTLWFRL